MAVTSVSSSNSSSSSSMSLVQSSSPNAHLHDDDQTTSLGSLDFGSGEELNLDSYYSKLQDVENTKLAVYDNRQNSIQTKISAYSTLQSSLDTLKSMATKLASADFQKSATATVEDNAAYIPNPTDNAAAGTYDIKINQLATNQSSASTVIADKSIKLGSGSLSIKVGNGSAVSVKVSDASLASVRDAINNAKDSSGNALGVSAAIVTDAKGTYLTLTAKNSGEANAFSISATGDAGLTGVISSISTKVQAQDAKFTVNGVDLDTASNQVTGVIPGLDLTLAAVSTKSQKTTITSDTTTLANGVAQFVDAYNNVLKTISSLTHFDASKPADNGPLFVDTGTRQITSTIKGLIGSDAVAALAKFGVTPVDMSTVSESNPAGSLKIDSDKLAKALSTGSTDLKKLLGDDKSGLMSQMSSAVNALEDNKVGIITTSNKTFKDQIDNLTVQKQRATEISVSRMQTYRANFIKLNQFKTNMDAQLDALKAQFAAMKKSSD